MGNLEQQFLNKENFYLAFKRLNYYLQQSNEWHDPIELAKYEANLETNIYKLIEELKNGEYSTKEIEPLPFPKKNNFNGSQQLRQYFKIHIEDQLVWIALVNIIGGYLEEKMPFWSYGNRIFQPIWYDENNKLIKGSFKNSSANLYRKWNQSWPFYRRHISMTIKTMGLKSKFTKGNLDSAIENKIFEEEEKEHFSNYKYLNPSFWSGRKTDKLYWIGLDFKNFFPSINPEIVINNIKKHLVRKTDGSPRDDTKFIFETLEKLLHFPLNISGWNEKVLLDEDIYGLKNTEGFYGVPTGLFVSGFLANVAMLDIDIKLNDYIQSSKNVALFKFVDDQVVLSNSKDGLFKFLNFYKRLLKDSNTGVEFQNKKTCPENTYDFNQKGEFIFKEHDDFKEPLIDVNFPEPLMTHTLQKMSALNTEDYELLDSEEIDETISDLKHFLLADFPDSEMKRETRMAFASMKLCLLSKQIRPNFKKLDMNLEENFIIYKSKVKLNKSDKRYDVELEKAKNKYFSDQFDKEITRLNEKQSDIFKLLLKAVNENPDKLKLWKRLIEFCSFTGFDGLKSIFKTIENIKIHDQGKAYIKAYCLLLIQEKYIYTFNFLNSENVSFWKKSVSEKFLLSVDKLNSKNINFEQLSPFISQSLKNFDLVKIFLNSTKNTKKDFKLNYFESNFESFMWYILNNINGPLKIKIWTENIENINIDNPVSWSLLTLFPDKIPISIINQIKDLNKKVENLSDLILENFEFRNKKNGLIYEMFENRLDVLKQFSNYYPEIFSVLNFNSKTHIPLNLWLKTIQIKSEDKSWVDVRLFEWSILEIIKQIGNALIEEQKKDTIFNQSKRYSFHPSNYLIPKEWMIDDELSWKNWKEKTKNHIVILNDEEYIINDTRYFPADKQWRNNEINYFFGNHNTTLILELSTLMIKLLSKSFVWSNHVNKIKFIDQHFSEVSNILETVPVSSDTRLLLSNIFSKSNSIDFHSNSFFNFENGKSINSIEDFNNEILIIQNKLEKNHFELLGSNPRQLTIIDIDKLNEAKKIY